MMNSVDVSQMLTLTHYLIWSEQDLDLVLQDLPGVILQVLVDVIHHLTLGGLVGHGLVQFTGHQSLGHGLLTALPQEQRHLLPFHQHGPHHQLVEGVLEPADLRVVHIDLHLLLLLLVLLPFPLGTGLIVLWEVHMSLHESTWDTESTVIPSTVEKNPK